MCGDHTWPAVLPSRYFRKLVLLALTGLFFAALVAPTTQAESRKRVLCLFSLRRDSPVHAAAETVFLKSLRDGLNGQLDYYSEYIDEPRFSDSGYQEALRDFIKRKYAGQKFDLIITSQRAALSFMTRYGDQIFPNTPVFFVAGKGVEIPNERPRPNFTGVLYKVDLRPTLELALKLQPGLKHVFVITGASVFDQHYEQGARDQWREFEGRLTFTYSSGQPLDELKQTVAHLPADSAIFHVTMFEDRVGNRLLTDEVLSQLSSVASVPIYSFGEAYLQYGILGGSLLSFDKIFEQAVPVALRVLRGERVEDIPVTEVDPTVVGFDWRQLQRFKINEGNLPAGGVVLFREFTFWERYKWRVVIVAALLLLQTVLIAALLWQRSKRRRAMQSLAESEREFSTLVENSPDIISRLDRNLRYIYISPAFEKVTGVPTERFIGKTPSEIALDDYDWQNFEACCREAMLTRKPAQLAFDYHGRNYWTRVVPEFSGDGRVESVLAISEDVTDRIQSERELSQLTVRLFNLQDEERRRIARELHDGTAQNLFAISVNLAKLNKLGFMASDEMQQLVAECQSLSDESVQEVRTLSYLLHPPLLDLAGLVSALQWYVEGFTKRSGIYVEIFAQQIGRLPTEVEMALFRVVQEALTNVRRHSGSEIASIRLERRGDEIALEIRDRGHGLSTELPADASETYSMGVGIPGMRQRLRQLGGALEIVSKNGHGTTISAVVPLTNGGNHGTHPSRGRS